MSKRVELVKTSITLSKRSMDKSRDIVDQRMIAGITNRSALIEYALEKVFKEIFKDGDA